MSNKKYLTEKDIAYLEKRFKDAFVTKDEFKDFRSILFDRLDEILTEVKASREEQTILASGYSDQRERIEKLEEIHPSGQHAV